MTNETINDNVKIWIDTDAGDDVDDAFAVVMAACAGLQIEGVSTVYRNAAQRAMLVKTLLRSLRLGHTPVYAGADDPIREPVRRYGFETRGADGKIDIPHFFPDMACAYDGGGAADAILAALRKQPGELTLVGLGPMTNLAAAFAKDPAAFRSCRELVLMGGCYAQEFAEWNIRCDPEAARIVFASGVKIRAVGLEHTRNCVLSPSETARIASLPGETFRLLSRMLAKYAADFRGERAPCMHDPLAVSVLTADFCRFQPLAVTVGTEGAERGLTLPAPGAAGGANPEGGAMQVAAEADCQNFKRYLLELLEEGRERDGSVAQNDAFSFQANRL
ncbi:MAG: nucleoside hydrolase [Clostridiales bacterium]|jgi:purine nucleosidase/pyrimidine-specific ribonucleoside hydrolase|nr:nucleoside hydrolase [Clostridiales bacterium]